MTQGDSSSLASIFLFFPWTGFGQVSSGLSGCLGTSGSHQVPFTIRLSSGTAVAGLCEGQKASVDSKDFIQTLETDQNGNCNGNVLF